MTITLHPEQEAAIRQAIDSGAFRSVDEFIDAAIAMLPHAAGGESPTPVWRSRHWELREGLSLGNVSIRELIGESRE